MGEPIFEEPDEGAAADMPIPDSPLTARRKKKEKEKKESELDEAERARIEQESEEASVRRFLLCSVDAHSEPRDARTHNRPCTDSMIKRRLVVTMVTIYLCVTDSKLQSKHHNRRA